MATEKQIAANRLNAQQSTGPGTPEGKAIASRNSMRHHILGRNILLRAECPQSFNTLVSEFYADYNPVGATERTLVDTLAVARWRSLRLSNLEAVQVDYEFDRQRDPALAKLDNATRTGIAYRDASERSGVLNLINRAEARLQRQFDSALDRLLRLRAQQSQNQNKDRTEPPPAEFRADEPNSIPDEEMQNQ